MVIGLTHSRRNFHKELAFFWRWNLSTAGLDRLAYLFHKNRSLCTGHHVLDRGRSYVCRMGVRLTIY